MMLYGAIFGCLSPVLSVAAFLSYKFPFVYPKDEVVFKILCKIIYILFNFGIFIFGLVSFLFSPCFITEKILEICHMKMGFMFAQDSVPFFNCLY